MTDLARHHELRLRRDPGRVIARLFVPGQELVGGSDGRISETIERVMALSESDVATMLDRVLTTFETRHRDFRGVLDAHASRVLGADGTTTTVSESRRLLLGATFTHEYAVEGAALCNPCLVAHPDQSGLSRSQLRVVMSVRAIGEGHVSSMSFRSGVIDERGELRLDDVSPYATTPELSSGVNHRSVVRTQLEEHGVSGESVAVVLDHLGPSFSDDELSARSKELLDQRDLRANAENTVNLIERIADESYRAQFADDSQLSERVLWPATPNEFHGIEDGRFVRFVEGETATYYATYTAFDGLGVSQHLLATHDFQCFESSPMAGHSAGNKGLALFPRKVAGQYVALSRHDRESNSVTFSTDLRCWGRSTTIQTPQQPWEMIQLGNCGSPVELNEGWLVLTHGVGPMRTYSIGALLLDLNDPTQVIGRLTTPLVTPHSAERDGYVPNVVYSCGAIIHEGTLVIPLGVADSSIGFASIAVSELLSAMTP